MEGPPFANKRSWFLVASAVAFAAILAFSVYSKIQTSSLNRKLAALNAEKIKIAEEDRLGENRAASANAALAVKDQLRKIESEQIAWSKIIEKIDATIPKLRESATPIVTFQSYNGNEDGKISVSAVTRADSADAFSDIAALIRAFVAEGAFKQVFVPSITRSINPDGAAVLSFSFNFEYQKQKF